jgi:hypothetical protein
MSRFGHKGGECVYPPREGHGRRGLSRSSWRSEFDIGCAVADLNSVAE